MSQSERTVVHVHKLATGTKLLLAAIAVGLVLNALAPFLQGTQIKAQGSIPLGLLSLACEGELPKHGETIKMDCSGSTF